MKINRRDVLLSSASAVGMLGASRSVAQVLHPENQTSAAALYGSRAGSQGHRDQALLLQFQEQRKSPPHAIADFGEYLKALPLTKKIDAEIASGKVPDSLYHLLQWNHHALDFLALDHTKYLDKDNPVDTSWAEQIGPHRSSRALAIVHIAMAEAVNFAHKGYESYGGIQSEIASITGIPAADAKPSTISIPLAITYAAYETLIALFPQKQGYAKACLSETLHLTLKADDDDDVQKRGADVGRAAAHATLASRGYNPTTGVFGDGSHDGEQRGQPRLNAFALEPTFVELFPPTKPPPPPEPDPNWEEDPISPGVNFALGGRWSEVNPFVLDKSSPTGLFIPPGPPEKGSVKFKAAYADVREVGGDSQLPASSPDGLRWRTPTTRTGAAGGPLDEANETFKAIFWGYDATAYLCAPPRLYTMIATSIALGDPAGRFSRVADMARYLAVVTVSLADAGIAAWTAKYKYHFARPITWIRSDHPQGLVDGVTNAHWTPFGQVASNLQASSGNTTPPFPSYPSGHAVFGAALFSVLREMWGLADDADGPAFTFVSDEYNGYNRSVDDKIRPLVPRKFKSFSAAEAENARSRVWLGIHWQFDADDGVSQGRSIGHYVAKNAFKKISS